MLRPIDEADAAVGMLSAFIPSSWLNMTEIDLRDVKVDTYTGGPRSDVAVRVTHLPTGTSAKATHRSPLQAKRRAMEELGRLLNAVREK